MEENPLFQRVVQHIGEYLETDVSHLTPGSRPATALPGLSSLKLFEMLLYLEDCFGVQFDDSVTEHMDSVGDLVRYVEQHVAPKGASA